MPPLVLFGQPPGRLTSAETSSCCLLGRINNLYSSFKGSESIIVLLIWSMGSGYEQPIAALPPVLVLTAASLTALQLRLPP